MATLFLPTRKFAFSRRGASASQSFLKALPPELESESTHKSARYSIDRGNGSIDLHRNKFIAFSIDQGRSCGWTQTLLAVCRNEADNSPPIRQDNPAVPPPTDAIMTKTNAFPSPCLPPLLDFNTFPFGAGWRNWGTRYSQNATRIESTSVIGSSRGRAAAVTPIFGGAFSTDAGALDFQCGSSISIA